MRILFPLTLQIIFWAKESEFDADDKAFAAVRAVSKKLKGQLVFVTSNNEKPDADPITNFFGLKGIEEPVVSRASPCLAHDDLKPFHLFHFLNRPVPDPFRSWASTWRRTRSTSTQEA